MHISPIGAAIAPVVAQIAPVLPNVLLVFLFVLRLGTGVLALGGGSGGHEAGEDHTHRASSSKFFEVHFFLS